MLDSIERVPAGALVLRRRWGSGWSVAAEPSATAGARLVARWPPLFITLVLAPAAQASRVRGHPTLPRELRILQAREQRLRAFTASLEVLGTLELAALVLGVPAASTRFGGAGLIASVAAVLMLACWTALVAATALRMLGTPPREALRLAAPLLSPFSAPRAVEVVLRRTTVGLSRFAVARHVLGDDAFRSWIRPAAYDFCHSPGDAGATAHEMARAVGHEALRSVVASPPDGVHADECYCPRCGAVYRGDIATCSRCEELPLARSAATS
ncbi:MAG TPA: hypothetical protein VFK13_02625 [Gemmatimonadaceae bacterium]|nr:hypothetical protein [Gemmatimonadaceae bacterium]